MGDISNLKEMSKTAKVFMNGQSNAPLSANQGMNKFKGHMEGSHGVLMSQGQNPWLQTPSKFPEDNPLTKPGKKVMSNMKSEYGEKKGKSVFYASINKGKKGSSKWHGK